MKLISNKAKLKKILRNAAKYITPPPKLLPSEWCEANLTLGKVRISHQTQKNAYVSD